MPELPEVETVVTSLRSRVVGTMIARIHHLRPDIITPVGCDFRSQISNRRIIDITRRGKRIVFSLDNQHRFYIHLGMTGRLTIESAAAPQRIHTHLILELANARRRVFLHFVDPRRFGGIWWLGTESPAGTMGPEPLLIRPTQLAARLTRTRRPIKNALLDQNVIAGIGNIYADEALFLSRIHPLRPAHTLAPDEILRLNRAIKRVLRQAIRHKGSTLRDYVDADGIKGAYQKKHNVYARATQPCRTCRSPIERLVLSARSAHFCPTCQPLSSATKTPS